MRPCRQCGRFVAIWPVFICGALAGALALELHRMRRAEQPTATGTPLSAPLLDDRQDSDNPDAAEPPSPPVRKGRVL